MRTDLIAPGLALLGLLLSAGCGEKKPPESSADAAEAAAPAEPEPVAVTEEAPPEPEAAPAPPPPPADNADLNITVTRADGSRSAGHVKRIERSVDWYAEEGWTDEPKKLTLSLESSTELLDVTWDQVASVAVTRGDLVNDVSCEYTSETNPWTYTCTLKTPTTARLKDGRSFDVSSRYKWRFTYDDDSQEVFWLAKLPAQQQDEIVQTIDRGGENVEMYVKLQDQLREEVKTLVRSVSVQ